MSCCCSSDTGKSDAMQGRTICPACGQPCFPVSRQTMLHQVQFPENQRISENDYAFCANHDCNSGYFSASDMIPKASLRAFRPGQQAMLCHCFDISESVHHAALADGTATAIKAFVVQQIKAGLCACESRNPSGRCCLAGFRAMGKRKREKAHDS